MNNFISDHKLAYHMSSYVNAINRAFALRAAGFSTWDYHDSHYLEIKYHY